MAKKCVVCDNCEYNVMRELVELNKLLWNIDVYIKDAKKAKHAECLTVFEQIKKDAIKNAVSLKQIYDLKCRK